MDKEEKKKHTCHYVDIDTSELWEMLTKYSFLVNASKTTSMNGMAKIWTGQLMYNILSQVITTNVSLVITTWQMHPNLFNTSTLLTSLLSKQEHIASLE
jgi:hypothetical protein